MTPQTALPGLLGHDAPRVPSAPVPEPCASCRHSEGAACLRLLDAGETAQAIGILVMAGRLAEGCPGYARGGGR